MMKSISTVLMAAFLYVAGPANSSTAFAAVEASGREVNLAPIGAHYPIFIVEKSENPQNVLVAYTKLDAKCRVERDVRTGEPLLDYYWMMDGQTYKPVHRLIKSGIRERLRVEAPSRKNDDFFIRIKDLKELQQDIENPVLQVEAHPVGKKAAGPNSKCAVSAAIKLGPSDKNRLLHLHAIYTESAKSIVPPFRKVKSVTLKGSSGADVRVAPFERKYEAL